MVENAREAGRETGGARGRRKRSKMTAGDRSTGPVPSPDSGLPEAGRSDGPGPRVLSPIQLLTAMRDRARGK